MRAAVASVWAVIVTIGFRAARQRVANESFWESAPDSKHFRPWTIGIVMASYYVGYSVAPLTSRAIIARTGHAVTMAVGAAIAAVVIVAHGYLVTPVAWAATAGGIGIFALQPLCRGRELDSRSRRERQSRSRLQHLHGRANDRNDGRAASAQHRRSGFGHARF